MADVKIIYNPADVRKVQKLLRSVPNAMPKVMSRGINNTTKSSRTKIVRELNKQTGLKQKTIRKSIRFYSASYRRWQAKLHWSDDGLLLGNFNPRQTQKGVSYRIKKAHRLYSTSRQGNFDEDRPAGRNLIEGAFVARMKSGHHGVFIRKEQGSYKANKLKPGKKISIPPISKRYRLPILELKTDGLVKMYENAPNLAHRIQSETGKDLQKNIETQVRMVLQKARSA